MERIYRHSNKKRRTQKRGLLILIRDVVLLIICLNLFALFHHVIPRKLKPASETNAYAPPRETESVQASGTTVDPAMPDTLDTASGDFTATFPTTDTGANATYFHQTDAVRVAVRQVQENDVTYFVADVYVKKIEALHTAFAKGTYGKSIYEYPAKTAAANGAVFAVTGDYYSARNSGIVIRNGELYRDVPAEDVCVLYRDGEMKTYQSAEFDLAAAMQRGVWQAWSFGPPLLTSDGTSISTFSSQLADRHPRSAIGYYAPGHYCFVVVDGRQKGYSVGMRLAELSALFYQLGCKQAYNLDGGATAIMLWNGQVLNKPYKGGRESGDIVWLC